MSELLLTLAALVVALIALIWFLYNLKQGELSLSLPIIFIIGIYLSLAMEDGNGIYARTFYSKQARAAWMAETALQDKLWSGTEYRKIKLACPVKKIWDIWDETTKSQWRAEMLLQGRAPYSGDCYAK